MCKYFSGCLQFCSDEWSKLHLPLFLISNTKDSDPECVDFKALQLIQNNPMRTLNGTKIKDMVSTSFLLSKFGMLSINQLNAQVKLVEIWKALYVEDYAMKINQQSSNTTRVSKKADTKGKPIEIGKSCNLIQSNMELIKLSCNSCSEITDKLEKYNMLFSLQFKSFIDLENTKKQKTQKTAIVIDGITLT